MGSCFGSSAGFSAAAYTTMANATPTAAPRLSQHPPAAPAPPPPPPTPPPAGGPPPPPAPPTAPPAPTGAGTLFARLALVPRQRPAAELAAVEPQSEAHTSDLQSPP